MKHISSRDNAFFKDLKRLVTSSQARKRAGLSLLDGVHLCQAYRAHAGAPEHVLVAEETAGGSEIAPLLTGVPNVVAFPRAMLAELEGTEHGQGIVYVVRTPRPAMPARIAHPAVLLDRVQDPGNVGSILRTCAAAGVDQVFLGKGTAFGWSPKVLRAGMGAHFALSIFEECNLHDVVDRLDIPLVATSSHAAQTLWSPDLPPRAAWLFGHEGQGVEPELAARAGLTVSIPIARTTESLNVAAAVAICLFEARRRAATA